MNEIYGLTSTPNGKDFNLSSGAWIGPIEISEAEHKVLKNIISMYTNPITIMEIGVFRNGKNSFTETILNTKLNDSIYLGIDLDDKSVLNNDIKHIYTLRVNSFDQNTVRNKLKELNINTLNILLIDGDHSIEGCVNDWKYVDMLSNDGTVIIHDTSSHVGPREFVKFIDKNIFDVTIYNNGSDNGITTAKKI